MSGRVPIKVYQYDNEGKFLKTFNSMSEVRVQYFPNDIGKRPLFGSRDYIKDYTILNDNTLISLNRIGRQKVKFLFKLHDNKYVPKKKIIKQEIECYNLAGDLLGTFTSIFAASILCNIPFAMVHKQLNRNTGTGQNRNLIFKYKEL